MTAGTWFKTAIGVSGLWLCTQGAPAWAAPVPGTPASMAAAVQPEPPTPPSEQRTKFAQTYQQREHAAEAQKNFEGGGAGLYIGGSTAAVVLLLVILIVIL